MSWHDRARDACADRSQARAMAAVMEDQVGLVASRYDAPGYNLETASRIFRNGKIMAAGRKGHGGINRAQRSQANVQESLSRRPSRIVRPARVKKYLGYAICEGERIVRRERNELIAQDWPDIEKRGGRILHGIEFGDGREQCDVANIQMLCGFERGNAVVVENPADCPQRRGQRPPC